MNAFRMYALKIIKFFWERCVALCNTCFLRTGLFGAIASRFAGAATTVDAICNRQATDVLLGANPNGIAASGVKPLNKVAFFMPNKPGGFVYHKAP